MSDDQVRTVDKDIKTGLWQNNLDGRFIKVRSVGLTVITYNDEGCKGVYDMGVSVLLDNYRLYAADKPAPTVDDAPAQTFGDIKWDEGTVEKCEAILVTACPKCGSTVPADSVVNTTNAELDRWAVKFLKAMKELNQA